MPETPIRNTIEAPFTGSAAISANTARIQPGAKFRLLAVRLHMSAAPTTPENFTITLDSGRGSAYDVVLHKEDLSVGSITDLVVPFGGDEHIYQATDEIDCAYANTDTNTYGLVIVYEYI